MIHRERWGAGLLVALLLVALGATSSLRAQRPTGDEAQLRVLDDQERLAVLRGDRAALERLWSERLTVNAPTNRVNVGRSAVLAVVAQGGMHYREFERTVEVVRVDGDLGLVMGSEIVVPAASGPAVAGAPPTATPRRFTNVWKREHGTWRLVARHANVVTAR